MRVITGWIICLGLLMTGMLLAADEGQKILTETQFNEMKVEQQQAYLEKLSVGEIEIFLNGLSVEKRVSLSQEVSEGQKAGLQKKYYAALTSQVNSMKTEDQKKFVENLNENCPKLEIKMNDNGAVKQILVKVEHDSVQKDVEKGQKTEDKEGEEQSETEAVQKPGAETGAEQKPGAETEAEQKPGAETGAVQKPGAETEAEQKPGAETEAVQKPGAETVQKPGAEAVQKPGAEAVQKPGANGNHRPGIDGDRKPGIDGDRKPGIEGDRKPGIGGDRKPVIEVGQPGGGASVRPVLPVLPSRPSINPRPVPEISKGANL